MGGEGETARDTRLIDVLSSRRPAICMLTCGYAMTSSLVRKPADPSDPNLTVWKKDVSKINLLFFSPENLLENTDGVLRGR